MSTTLYIQQENGNLKLVAEVEDIDNPALAVDALLDDAPRLKEREFVALSGSLEDGKVTRVTVDDDEPVNPRRSISVTGGNGDTPDVQPRKRRGRPRKAAAPSTNGRRRSSAAEPAEEAPAKKRGAAKKRGSAKKAAPAKKRGRPRKQAPANPVTGRVRTSSKASGSARKASPFKTRPDDE
jgi:hypothetical protein